MKANTTVGNWSSASVSPSAETTTSPTHKTAQEGLLATIFILSIIGNFAMIGVLVKKSRQNSPANRLLLNMVVSELAVVVTSIPFDIIALESDGAWLYGKAMCKVLYPLQTLPYGALVLSITAISYHRYMGIVFPMARNLGRVEINILIISVWTVSLLTVVPYSVFLEFKDADCYESWSVFAGNCYTMALFIAHYAVPLCIISYCYINIAIKLRQDRSRNQNIISGSAHAKKRRQERTGRAARMVILFVLVFAVCMFPHHFVWLYKFGQGVSDHLITFAYLFTFASTVANPLIYFTHNQKFRKEMLHVFCHCSSAPREQHSSEREMVSERESQV